MPTEENKNAAGAATEKTSKKRNYLEVEGDGSEYSKY